MAPLCAALGLPRATYYRRRERAADSVAPQPPSSPAVVTTSEAAQVVAAVEPADVTPKKSSPRALSEQERAAVLVTLNEERFCNLAPAEVYATLLDEGKYRAEELQAHFSPASHVR